MDGSDMTTLEQVQKSIGMCRSHGLHNTEATLRALLDERDAMRARADRAEAERDAERVANGHEKRLRLEMVAHVESAEARVAELEGANAALRAANDMLLRAITGDDNG